MIKDIKKERNINEGNNIVMLKRFSFRNCYSFRDKTVFSMEAVYAMKDNVNFVMEIKEGVKCEYLLPVAAIYGKNAGGKSNVIKVLNDAARNVCQRDLYIQNIPFFATSEDEVEVFEHKFNFLINNFEYEYYYQSNSFEVLAESLGKRSVGSEVVFDNIFFRKGEEVTVNKSLGGIRKNVIEQASQNTSALIVNNAGAMRIKDCMEIYDWFRHMLSVTNVKGSAERERHLSEFAGKLKDDPTLIDRVSKFINKLDPSIKNVKPVLLRVANNDKRYQLELHHSIYESDESVGFPVGWESDGTKKILELYPVLMDALDNGKPLVFDELDTLLHPLVFRRIVEMFNDTGEGGINKKCAQLIFTAHNTIVVNREDLRRDEIHFVDKDEYGCSSSIRLSDMTNEKGEKIRLDASYDKLYLNGIFGAIPDNFSDATI